MLPCLAGKKTPRFKDQRSKLSRASILAWKDAPDCAFQEIPGIRNMGRRWQLRLLFLGNDYGNLTKYLILLNSQLGSMCLLVSVLSSL